MSQKRLSLHMLLLAIMLLQTLHHKHLRTNCCCFLHIYICQKLYHLLSRKLATTNETNTSSNNMLLLIQVLTLDQVLHTNQSVITPSFAPKTQQRVSFQDSIDKQALTLGAGITPTAFNWHQRAVYHNVTIQHTAKSL